MSEIAEAFRQGGIWMYLILGATLLTVPWLLALTAAGVFWRRIPAVLWWLMPFLIAALGALGTGLGLSETLAALEVVAPDQKQALMAKGLSLSLNTIAFAALVNVFTGVGVSIGAGLSNAFGPGEESDWSFGMPAAALGVAFLASVGLGAWVLLDQLMGAATFMIPASLLFGGVGCALAGVRTPEGDDAAERASDRYTAAAGVLFAVTSSTVAAMTLGVIDAFMALETVAPDQRGEIMGYGMEAVSQSGLVGVVGLLLVLVIGGLIIWGGGEHALSRPVAIDAVTCLVALFLVLGSYGYTLAKASAFIPAFQETIVDVGGEAPDSPKPKPRDE